MAQRRAKGEGSLIKINGCRFWYAQYYDENGRQIRVSTKTEVKQEALGVLRKLMGDRDNGLMPLSDLRKIRYGDLRESLVDNYVSKGNKSLKVRANGDEAINGLKALDDFFGYCVDVDENGLRHVTGKGVPVTRITTDAAREFVRKRRDAGIGNAAINRSLAALRRMLKLAKQEKKIPDVPFIEFQKEPSARKGFLPTNKFEELLAQFPTNLKPLVAFLYFCGVRVGEALQIEWAQVDLNKRLIRIEDEQTKTGEPRIVPLPSILVMMLEGIEPKTERVFDSTNLRKEWRKACAAVGLGRIIEIESKKYDPRYEGLTIHDFRRSAIRNLINAGVPEKVAMQISGHKTRSVFDRYHIVSTEDVINAMRRVEAASLKIGETALLSERLVKK